MSHRGRLARAAAPRSLSKPAQLPPNTPTKVREEVFPCNQGAGTRDQKAPKSRRLKQATGCQAAGRRTASSSSPNGHSDRIGPINSYITGRKFGISRKRSSELRPIMPGSTSFSGVTENIHVVIGIWRYPARTDHMKREASPGSGASRGKGQRRLLAGHGIQ